MTGYRILGVIKGVHRHRGPPRQNECACSDVRRFEHSVDSELFGREEMKKK